jgi:ketosteroid isomerase-like protein
MSDNVETAKAAYSAFQDGDMETLKGMFAEDAVWVSSDELPLGGTTEGRDAIISSFAELPSYWSEFGVEPEEFIDGGDWVTVRGTQRGTGKAGSFECSFAHLMRFADGKVTRGEFYNDSAKAKAALG